MSPSGSAGGKWLLVALVCALACGCAHPQSTRMTADDLNAMANQMSQSLARSSLLAGRTPTSPPMVVTIQKVTNLTGDVMTESEEWFVMSKIQGSLPIQSLREQKNITFVIPAEDRAKARAYLAENEGPQGQDYGSDRKPTHVMTAVFRSVERAQAEARTDLYYCEFEITDLATGERAWTDKFEYKRAAKGQIWD